MSKTIAIFGAGGHGRVLSDCAALCGFERIDIFDDTYAGRTFKDMLAAANSYTTCAVAIGDNALRLTNINSLSKGGANLDCLIHPAAVLSSNCKLGQGSFVAAGAIVSTHASVGIACILNTNCSVDHDCVLEDAVHICPGSTLAGGVYVEQGCTIGVGASIREGVRIGARSFIGAGAAVVGDVFPDQLMLGVPASAHTKDI